MKSLTSTVISLVSLVLVAVTGLSGSVVDPALPSFESIVPSGKPTHVVTGISTDWKISITTIAEPNREISLSLAGVASSTSSSADLLEQARTMLIGEAVWIDPSTDASAGYLVFRAPEKLLLNAEILRRGWASAGEISDKRVKDALKAYEQFAKLEKRGVWADKKAISPSAPQAPASRAPKPSALTPTPSEIPAATPKDDEESKTVYITKSGSKYHTAGCSYARKSGTPISLKEAKERGLTPCSKCQP